MAELARRAADQSWYVRLGNILTCAGNRFMDFVDRRQIIRRGAFLWMLWLTGNVVFWTMEFAWYSNRPGLEVAAIIGAIVAPLAALQGAIFKFYDQAQARRNGAEGKDTSP